MRAFAFRDPQLLWLLLILPVMAIFAFWRKRRAVLRFPTTHVLAARGHRGWRARLLWLPTVLQMAAVGLAVIALARPMHRVGTPKKQQVEGIDLAVALDLSTSMEAADLKPKNRLQVAKQVLTDFLAKRDRDRVALVVFGGAAYTQVPLTLDHDAVAQVVSQLHTRGIEDGTAIGDAVGVALNRLRDSTAKSRAVVLITDGDNNAGRLSPADAAKLAHEMGVPVYAILVGKGGAVPMPVGRDAFGEQHYEQVEVPVNPALLQTIAKSTGGEFYRATDRAGLEAGLQHVLDRMQRTKLVDDSHPAPPDEKFGIFLSSALLLAAADLVLRNGPLKVAP